MLDCRTIYQALTEAGVRFFSGVPDSLLKDFCACVSDHARPEDHLIAANEGGAVALAAGHCLASGEPGCVYLQNSGLGNAVNPLASLADPEVYSIPLVLVIGWRGEPGRPDEPQHVKQGRVTLPLLAALDIPCQVLPDQTDAAVACIRSMVSTIRKRGGPGALVVRDRTFAPYPAPAGRPSYTLTRERAIQAIAGSLDPRTIVVSTTGKASRELYEHRVASGQRPGRDFLTVGSMGHASQIALGIALSKSNRTVCCLDGDGAALMHLGSLAIIGSRKPKNFHHLVLNNGAHDSVGGQPTAGFDIDLPAIALACGYRWAARSVSAETLRELLPAAAAAEGPRLLEVRVSTGARADLGRPTTTPVQNKLEFMEFLRS